MTPPEIAASGSEHRSQAALFAWSKIALRYGFVAADDPKCYTEFGYASQQYGRNPRQEPNPSGKGQRWADDGGIVSVPELEWLHAIPNGGRRDGFTAALMKSEGVKKGICDIFLPLPMFGEDNRPGVRSLYYAGLYIEMKKAKKGRVSSEQSEFIEYARRVGYAVAVCFDWLSASREIVKYVEAVRNSH